MAGEEVADFLRTHREARKLSQPKLAELSGVGRDYISSIERGRISVVYPQTANRLKDALGFAGFQFLEAMGYETDAVPEGGELTAELMRRIARLEPEQHQALLGLLNAFER